MPRSYIRDKLLAEYIPSEKTEKLFSERAKNSNWADETESIDFFISYSSKEEEMAIRFAKYMMDQIKDCLIYVYAIDPKAIKGANEVSVDRIEQFLKKSKYVLFLQSEKSIKSFWCAWELGYMTALGTNKCIIVRINNDFSFAEHREYLKAYPRLMINGNANVPEKAKFVVLRPDERIGIPLERYMKGDREFLATDWHNVINSFMKQ